MFQGLDGPFVNELAAISRIIYGDFNIPSLRTLRRHLLNANIPKKLFRKIKETAQMIRKMNLSRNACSAESVEFRFRELSTNYRKWICLILGTR